MACSDAARRRASSAGGRGLGQTLVDVREREVGLDVGGVDRADVLEAPLAPR
jgi:hypothetical protein